MGRYDPKPEYLQLKSTWDRSKNDDILCPFCDVRTCSLTDSETLICRNPKCGRHINLVLAIKSGDVDFAHIDFLKDLSLHGRTYLVESIKEAYKLSLENDKKKVNEEYKKSGDRWKKK